MLVMGYNVKQTWGSYKVLPFGFKAYNYDYMAPQVHYILFIH